MFTKHNFINKKKTCGVRTGLKKDNYENTDVCSPKSFLSTKERLRRTHWPQTETNNLVLPQKHISSKKQKKLRRNG